MSNDTDTAAMVVENCSFVSADDAQALRAELIAVTAERDRYAALLDELIAFDSVYRSLDSLESLERILARAKALRGSRKQGEGE